MAKDITVDKLTIGNKLTSKEVRSEDILIKQGDDSYVSVKDALKKLPPSWVKSVNGILPGEDGDIKLPVPRIEVDSELSSESENPVQNKTLTKSLDFNEGRITKLEVACQRIGALDVGTDLTSLIGTVTAIRDIFRGEWRLIIQTPQDLVDFANAVNNGNTFYDYENNRPYTIVLNNNLDMEGYEMKPIGSQTPMRPFRGIFDGQNYRISNLTIDVTEDLLTRKGNGLFGEVSSGEPNKSGNPDNMPATVKNLRLDNYKLKSVAVYNGGICGHSGYGCLIDNCHITNAEFNLRSQSGGIFGAGEPTIKNCSFDGVINATKYQKPDGSFSDIAWIGGISGSMQGGSITNCQTKGSIETPEYDKRSLSGVGGLVGYSQVVTSNRSSIFYVHVTGCHSDLAINAIDGLNLCPLFGEFLVEYDSIPDNMVAMIRATHCGNTWNRELYPQDKHVIVSENDEFNFDTDEYLDYNQQGPVSYDEYPATSKDGNVQVTGIVDNNGNPITTLNDNVTSASEVSFTFNFKGNNLDDLYIGDCYFQPSLSHGKREVTCVKSSVPSASVQVTVLNNILDYAQLAPGKYLNGKVYLVYDKELIGNPVGMIRHGILDDAHVKVTSISGGKVEAFFTYKNKENKNVETKLVEGKTCSIEYPSEGTCRVTGKDIYVGTVEKTFTPKA